MTFARSQRAALLILLALTVSIALSGCGKKAWPEPSDTEHAITIVEVSGSLNNGCLFVDATLGGAWENVAAVYLKYGPADCPECPFTATGSIEFIPGKGNTVLANGRLSFQACGLDSANGYRWKIEVANRHSILRPVESKIMSTL